MQKVMPGMLEALSQYVNKAPFGQRALTLLGKFGGRSHAHINGPQPIEYYPSIDKGLRPVFVFKPSTSCLVPLDVCIDLLVQAPWEPSNKDKYYQQQAFNFIASCLNRVLNMDSQVADTTKSLEDQLAAALTTGSFTPPQNPAWSANNGMKSKSQYVAEEKAVEVCAFMLLFISVVVSLYIGYVSGEYRNIVFGANSPILIGRSSNVQSVKEMNNRTARIHAGHGGRYDNVQQSRSGRK